MECHLQKRPRILTKVNIDMLTEIISFEMAFEETSVLIMMKVVWKTVPGSNFGRAEAMLSNLSSYAQLGVGSCVSM